jgi:hypothetical protein
MKIHEKIKALLEKKGWKLKRLHREIQESFEEDSIDYRTLLRTIHGQTKLRESTLFQIASALEMRTEDIRGNTDQEESVARYGDPKRAYIEVEATDLNFLTARLVVLPGAKTEKEQDPIERGDFVKWLYCLQGEITCVILTKDGVEERHTIAKNKNFYFKSTQLHYFENNTNQKAVCLLIQNPKYIF